jgi:hypothetical protein
MLGSMTAQWRSIDDFDAMRHDPRAVPHFQRAASLAQFDPIVCDVIHVRHS